MIASQIQENLERLFRENRIVFWHDGEGEFKDDLKSLELDNVTVLRLDELGSLEIKVKLELEDSTGKYLIYAPFPQPEDADNWLLDIQLYSRTFQADSASVLLDDLGLINQSLVEYIRERQKFLQSKERLAKLKRLVHPSDDEKKLDLKILAVIARSEQPDVFEILMRLFSDFSPGASGDLLQIDLTGEIRAWSDIIKYDLAEPFWELIGEQFGYDREKGRRNLQDLLLSLMVTDLALRLHNELPQSLRQFRIVDDRLSQNATVFLDRWRQNAFFQATYSELSGHVAEILGIDSHIAGYSAEDLNDVMTFAAVDKRILVDLRDRLIRLAGGVGIEDISPIIQRRIEGHWAGIHLDKENHFRTIYDALGAAYSFFSMRWEQGEGFSFKSAEDAFKRYSGEIFKLDQHYRIFSELADEVAQHAIYDILKPVRENVEKCYCGWYLPQLALAWEKFLEGENGLLASWQIAGVRPQGIFFDSFVRRIIGKSPDRRVFVVVSDAFRYEAAEELTRIINGQKRFGADLIPLLGVLPSYTALGMAALLPHRELEYSGTKTLSILIDGKQVASIEQRNALLAEYNGLAVKSEDLLLMSKEAGREFVKDAQVVYVYHNQIDAKGDHAASESETFSAVRDAIKDLDAIVRNLVNNLNATSVFLTADHGFLFTESPMELVDKSKIEDVPAGTLLKKKRYLIGRDLGHKPGVWHGKTSITAGMKEGLEFWIPRGVSRFHFVGGARFVHGGAMLQEIVVPVVMIKQLKGKAAERAALKKVGISLLDQISKITNNTQKFTFIQTEAVSERIRPLMITVSLEAADGSAISNVERVTFDSSSQEFEERKRAVRLSINVAQVEKQAEYSLVWRDADTNIELGRLPVKIDLAFGRDF